MKYNKDALQEYILNIIASSEFDREQWELTANMVNLELGARNVYKEALEIYNQYNKNNIKT